MGGHRFFSKVPEVNEWWEKMLPVQGALPNDNVALGRTSTVVDGGPDPEQSDRVMLRRNRLSRIFFNAKFFDYPVSLKFETIKNMGLGTTIVVGFSYLNTVFHKRKEKSLEDFYINRFGKKLYSMFFENYTENLWGRHPGEISSEWGAHRVKGLSIKAVLKDIFGKIFNKKNRKVETSLIKEFAYPKLGPGTTVGFNSGGFREKGRHYCQKCKGGTSRKKAYPAYFDTYEHMDELRGYLNTIPNLFCVGRNGQHRYNNIDHSMCTSFETVKNILSGQTNKDNIWNVNTEKEYHEEKQDTKN